MKQKIVLAFSGGSDSTFLLEIIYRFTNRICHAVFFQTPFVSPATLQKVYRFLEEKEINYTILPIDLLGIPLVTANGIDRCYHCKKALFESLLKYFDLPGTSQRCMEGTNLSEVLYGHRPGLKALEELGIESPLRKAGITEEDIKTLRREHNISPGVDDIGCLATRIPTGTPLKPKLLKVVDAAEDFLRQRGFHHVRVRHHGETARIEVAPDELNRFGNAKLRESFLHHLESLGFSSMLLDLKGYQKGVPPQGKFRHGQRSRKDR